MDAISNFCSPKPLASVQPPLHFSMEFVAKLRTPSPSRGMEFNQAIENYINLPPALPVAGSGERHARDVMLKPLIFECMIHCEVQALNFLLTRENMSTLTVKGRRKTDDQSREASLTTQCWETLRDAIPLDFAATRLEIHFAKMNICECKLMFEIARRMPALTHWDLASVNIVCPERDLQALDCPSVSNLVLLSIWMGEGSLTPVIIRIIKGVQLSGLHIFRVVATKDEQNNLVQALAENQRNIASLHWSPLVGYASSIGRLMDVCGLNEETLTSFVLYGHRIEKDQGRDIIPLQGLMQLTHLRVLVLRENPWLRDEELAAMFLVLNANTTIEHIKIIRSGMDTQSFGALAECLVENQTLTHLSVSWHAEGAKRLVEAMEKNLWVVSLTVDGVPKGSNDGDAEGLTAVMMQLEEYLDRNRDLAERRRREAMSYYLQGGMSVVLNSLNASQELSISEDVATYAASVAYTQDPKAATQLAALNRTTWAHAQQARQEREDKALRQRQAPRNDQ